MVFVFLVLLPQVAFSATQMIIILKDGSQIKGDLVSFSGGIYTIHTSTLGDVKISSSQVANISQAQILQAIPPLAAPATTNVSPASDGEVDQKIRSAQTKLMNDPEMMAEIQGMIKDPEMIQLLSDPTLAKEVMSHDTKAIQNDPKAQQLINNPKMRALMDKLRNKDSSQ